MTSRNSFINILKEDRKRRTWTFVMFCLICFLMTAVFELNLEQYISRNIFMEYNMLEELGEMIREVWLPVHLVIGIAGACLYGFQGFEWLFKKEQVDFYHSQPMKREKRFFVIYLNGLLMFEIPMLIHLFLCNLLLWVRGYFYLEIIKIFLLDLMAFTILFFLVYHLVLLAIMLTGNKIVSIMIFGVLFGYSYVCKTLFELYFSSYFATYTHEYTSVMGWMNYISPPHQIWMMYRGITLDETKTWILSALILLLMAAVGAIGAFFLYKRRPSEAAEHAMAYEWAGDISRILIVLLSGMLCGLIFSFSGEVPLFWLYFGTILGILLAHGMLEAIFHFDIKAAFGKKKQLIISGILVLGIVTVFCFDLCGYDRYLPKEDQVEEVSYYIDLGEYDSCYQILTEEGFPKWADENFNGNSIEVYMQAYEEADLETNPWVTEIYRDDYQLIHSKTTNVKNVLSFVSSYLSYEEPMTDHVGSVEFIVHYKMKSGRDTYRRYSLPVQFVEEYYDAIYQTEEGRKVIYPYWNLSAKEISTVYVSCAFTGTHALELNQKEMEELVECYKKDIKEMTLKELINASYQGEIHLSYVKNGTETGEETRDLTLYIGSSYENLKQFLKERNVALTLPDENYKATEAVLYSNYSKEETETHPFWQGRDEVKLTQEQIEQLLPYMVSDQYLRYSEGTEYYSGTVTIKEEKTGDVQEEFFRIAKEDLPEELQVEQ